MITPLTSLGNVGGTLIRSLHLALTTAQTLAQNHWRNMLVAIS